MANPITPQEFIAKRQRANLSERSVKAKKPALIYFSAEPVRLDSVDEVQHKALKEFKEEMGKRGLYEQYESSEEFREKLSRQLAQTVNRFFASKKTETAKTVRMCPLFNQGYLNYRSRQANFW